MFTDVSGQLTVPCNDQTASLLNMGKQLVKAVAPLGCYKAYDGSCLPTFRDNLSVPCNDQATSLLNMGKQLVKAVAPLGCYKAYDGSCLPTFRDSLSVPCNDQAASLLNMDKQLPTRCVTSKYNEGRMKQ